MELILFALLALTLVAVGILASIAKMLQRWHDADLEASARIHVEQKRAIRRLTRERNKWEAAAARIMNIRLNAPAKSNEEPKAVKRRFVSPSEAIYRDQLQRAETGDVEPPVMAATNGVPPAVRQKFLKDAKPE